MTRVAVQRRGLRDHAEDDSADVIGSPLGLVLPGYKEPIIDIMSTCGAGPGSEALPVAGSHAHATVQDHHARRTVVSQAAHRRRHA
jgi:hypothetical protein